MSRVFHIIGRLFIMFICIKIDSCHDAGFCDGLPAGYYRDPLDCSSFYQCSNSAPTLYYSCSDGLMFNKVISNCDYAENVICDKHELKPLPQISSMATLAFRQHDKHTYTGVVIKQAQNVGNIIMCARVCTRTATCMSANYFVQEKMCQLMSDGPQPNTDDLVTDSNVHFIEMV